MIIRNKDFGFQQIDYFIAISMKANYSSVRAQISTLESPFSVSTSYLSPPPPPQVWAGPILGPLQLAYGAADTVEEHFRTEPRVMKTEF